MDNKPLDLSRREVMLLATGALWSNRFPWKLSESMNTHSTRFKYRMLLGWVNDISPKPLQGKPWPDISIDSSTVKDYKEYLRVAKDAGFNAFTVWGLYCSHAWPVPLRSPELLERKKIVDQILEEARRQGIKALFGIGVYSWGFDEIIRADPTCARNEGRIAYGQIHSDNGVAMCYHEPSAREWMRKIIDLCVKDFGAQGFGFQPADLGRCYCHECRLMSDAEYYIRVTNETADYARSIKPDLLLGLSAWGVEIGGPIESTQRLAKGLDFVTDVSDQSEAKGHAFRSQLAKSLDCALGSLGGPVIVPPQRWNRVRWFFPTAGLTGSNIRSLAEDGGTAFEFFVSPLNNPQGELMLHFVGDQLRNPQDSVRSVLGRVVKKLLNPKDLAATNAVVDFLLSIESAYVTAAGPLSGGEFDFEPLEGAFAGPPIYLERIKAENLGQYRKAILESVDEVPHLAQLCREPRLLSSIERCLNSVLADIDVVQAGRGK